MQVLAMRVWEAENRRRLVMRHNRVLAARRKAVEEHLATCPECRAAKAEQDAEQHTAQVLSLVRGRPE